MSVCLSMIVKNEAHVIQRCLRSVKPFITNYSISDTGSTDSTMDLIREELAGLPGVLTSDPWQDFGTNRNLALSRVTGDHVLIIDADEVLEHTGGPLELSPEFEGFQLRNVHPDLFFWATRIIRNDPRWKWHYKIHEALQFDGGNPRLKKIENLSLTPYFDSNRNKLGDKFLRDLKIFENEPATERNVFYHAQTLWCLGRHQEAIDKYYERAAMGGWEEEVYYSLWKAADLMKFTKPPMDVRAGALFRAYAFRPSRLEALVDLCSLLFANKQYDLSYRLSNIDVKPSEDILFVDPRTLWRIVEEHGLAAYYLGKKEEAREYFERVLTFDITPADQARTEKNIQFCVA